MPYSPDSRSETHVSPVLVPTAQTTTPDASSYASTVCTVSVCDDPAVVVLARADDLVETPGYLPEVLTSRLCASCARRAVDRLIRHAVLGRPAPSLALTAIDRA
jgi:hypothetical protein